MIAADHRCGTCGRGFVRDDNGMVACGAPVDQDATLGRGGINPIWAERKIHFGRIIGLAAALRRARRGEPPDPEQDARTTAEPQGSDANNMDPNDGATCKMWQLAEPPPAT